MPGKGTSRYWDTCNNCVTRFLAGLVDQGVVCQGADSDRMESGSKILTQTTRGNTLQGGGEGIEHCGTDTRHSQKWIPSSHHSGTGAKAGT